MNQDLDSSNRWSGIEVLVTGGASFIGSQLVDKLVTMGSKVTVVDNLSSGRFENLSESLSKISFIKKDLEYTNRSEIREIFKDKNYVFHLAAVHGGRGPLILSLLSKAFLAFSTWSCNGTNFCSKVEPIWHPRLSANK
jgi:hypothetical protein